MMKNAKACLMAGCALALLVALSSEGASATKKKPQKPPPPAITQEQARKICAKAYGLFYKAEVRRGQVICYI
ncbi:MAG: hypothetical protein U1E67_13950 [Hyphomicrobiales bacterium]